MSMERAKGVEPSSQPWQGCIIAAIRRPHIGAAGENRTHGHIFFRDVLYH